MRAAKGSFVVVHENFRYGFQNLHQTLSQIKREVKELRCVHSWKFLMIVIDCFWSYFLKTLPAKLQTSVKIVHLRTISWNDKTRSVSRWHRLQQVVGEGVLKKKVATGKIRVKS